MTPGRPDAELVRRHLLALDEAVQALAPHRTLPLDELRDRREIRWMVERGLQICAQNVLDVATHLAAGSGRDVADYATALDLLPELGVLPADFARRLRGLAGFRNVLVHGYLDLDPAVVHRILAERLDDFIEFARQVERHLRSVAAPE